MARKFDLMDSTKKEIFNGGRLAALGAIAGAATTSLWHYHPSLGDYVQLFTVGGTVGFALSLTVSALRDVMPATPQRTPRSFGVQSHSDSTALPEAAEDDYVTVNSGSKSLQLRRGDFEAAIPSGFGGSYGSKPQSISRPWREFFGKPQPIIASQLQAPRPVMREEVFFWSCGVQLSSEVVWKFLRYAERNRTHGRGLSERYWKRRNRSEWWNEAYYDPMIAMLDYASQKSRVQLVIVQDNKWRVLAKDCKTTYKVIAWAMHGAR
jgi:hypothetical protein